jgi:hypothetical protein
MVELLNFSELLHFVWIFANIIWKVSFYKLLAMHIHMMPIIYIQLPHNLNFNSISKDLWIAMFNYWKFSVQFYRVFRQIVHFTQDIILPNRVRVRGMVFNATFNNISVISWRSVLLVEETREKHRPVASHWQTLSHYVVSSIPRLRWIRTQNVSCNSYWLHR